MSEEFKNNLPENDDFIIENGFQIAAEEAELPKKKDEITCKKRQFTR